MQTGKTNLMNLVTTVQNGRAAGKKEPGLTETFQSYVAQGSNNLNQQGTSAELPAKREQTVTDGYHQDAYAKEKLQSDAYASKVDNGYSGQEQVQNDEDMDSDIGLTKEELEDLESDIRSFLKKELDMDDSELDEWLAVMNVSVFQLLEPANLQEFLLTVTETEPVDLLTNSSLIETFRQVQSGMEELMQAYDLEEPELNSILQDAMQKPEPDTSLICPELAEVPEEKPESETAPEMTPDLSARQTEQNGTSSEKEPQNQFTVREETTGIEVSVKVDHAGGKETGSQSESGQLEQSQQGIATEVIHQLTQAVNETEQTSTSFAGEIQQADILRQVIEQIKVFSGSDMNRLEVQLYPQHLGKLQIQVMMKNGSMTAQITTETEMAKAAVEHQLQQLKDTFREQNMKVDAVEVSVATSDFRREQERQDSAGEQKGSRSGRSRLSMNEFGMPGDELTEEELAAERLEAQGASVEFTA